eukprot:c27648_g1_i1 orf=428-814(-)
MAWNSSYSFCHSSTVGTRNHLSIEQNVKQLLSMLFAFLQSSIMPPGFTDQPPGCTDQPSTNLNENSRGTQITPACLTWFLFGIAFALVLLGSFMFMLGVMMVPLAAFMSTVVWVVGLFTDLPLPSLGV